MKFINRQSELLALKDKWKQNQPQLIIIYGKRRVGKTELIKQFLKNKPAIYFLADKRSHREQLKELSRVMAKHFQDPLLNKQGFSEWLDAFEYLKRNSSGKQFVLAIDEYPYLVEIDPATSSLFQKGWDEYLQDSNIFLILSGSSMAMMESEALIYKSPLYGRRTGQLLLQPLNFKESKKFFPKKNFQEFLKIFAITGGMPAYLKLFQNTSLKEGVKKNILDKIGVLHNEVEFILKEELRKPKNYLSILKAISWGKTKFGEIISESGLEKNVIHKYLSTLERLKIIEKEVPITEKNRPKSVKGIYKVSENFFRFWFQYIFPYKSDLEIGRFDEVWHKIELNFSLFNSQVYEKVCQEILWDLRSKIFAFERVGRWWDKNQEIDVIGLNRQEKKIIFGEAKWSNKPMGPRIFYELKNKADSVIWFNKERREYFILFSKSGFTAGMKQLAKQEKVFLVEKDRLI